MQSGREEELILCHSPLCTRDQANCRKCVYSTCMANTPHKVWGCSKDPLHQELQALSEVGADCQKFSSSRLHFVLYWSSSPAGHGSHHCTLAVELERGKRGRENERESTFHTCQLLNDGSTEMEASSRICTSTGARHYCRLGNFAVKIILRLRPIVKFKRE